MSSGPIADIAAGRPAVVVDDEDRENEGDIIFAAEKATPELLAFMVRYTSGVICVPMPGPDLDRLALPLMTAQNGERMRTAFTVTVDARDGVTTGISAADRTTTITRLADPKAQPGDFVKPGHIFPLRYPEGGVLPAPATPRPPLTWPGSPACARRGARRGRQRRRHHDAPARAARLRGRARPGPHLHRAAHRAPSPYRGAGHEGGPNHYPERVPPTGLPMATAPTWMGRSTWRSSWATLPLAVTC